MNGDPLLVLTRIWPSPTRPSVGSFVRERTRGVPAIRVVRPRWPGAPRPLIYLQLLADALSGGPVRGVESHVLVPTGFVGLIVARLRRVPLVAYAHGGDVRAWHRRPVPYRWLARLVARGADRVVTNSPDTARWIRRLGANPTIAPPGVDVGRFHPTPRPAERRVLYLGGANPRKGYEVAQRHADTLVGPWLRDVDPAEVPSLMAAHDVVLVPSTDEPFGIVAVEAIASGRWVVAAAVGGLTDIVIDGVNGTLVRDGDYAAALGSVPDYDPQEVARTAQRFSLTEWQAKLDQIWEEVLAEARQR